MTIRILCIVIALIAAVWISREIDLSGMWTVIFTTIGSVAVGFIVTVTPLNYEKYVTTVKSYQTSVISRYIVEKSNPPVMVATRFPIAVPVVSSARRIPDCYVSVYNGESDPIVFNVTQEDYGTLLEGAEVTVTYYYINNTLYNVKLNNYNCENKIDLRDSNIFTQHKLLEEALLYDHE